MRLLPAPAPPAPDLAVRESLLEMVRAALMLRLVALFPVVLGWSRGPHVRLGVVLVVVLVGANGVLMLALYRWAPLVIGHPGIVGVDVVLSLAALLGAGPQGPFLVYSVSASLVVGLIFPTGVTVLLTTLQVSAYLLALTVTAAPSRPSVAAITTAALHPLTAAVGWSFRQVHGRLVQVLGQVHAAEQERARQEAGDSERARLARELHDGVAKSLFGIALDAAALARRAEGDPELARYGVRLAAAAREASQQARQVLSDLRGVAEATASLPEAVPELVRAWSERTGVVAELTICPEARGVAPAPRVRLALLRGLEEALENVWRHAGAARVEVSLAVAGEVLRLTVTDDGVGVDPQRLAAAGLAGRFGVVGMRERLAQHAGSAVVEPVPGAGGGTRVRLEVPARGCGSVLAMARGALPAVATPSPGQPPAPGASGLEASA